MCFFGKQRYIAAIACLKKALLLGPFEWVISFNLGLVYLNTEQYVSAFNFFSAAINLKSDFAHSYMYLGTTLSKLEDFDNACIAYERAIEMSPDEWLFHLNYAIMLRKMNDLEQATKHFLTFLDKSKDLDDDKLLEEDVVAARMALERDLLGSTTE